MPSETTTADSMTAIQWTAPDNPNGEITMYGIRYWTTSDMSDEHVTDSVDGMTLMYTLPETLERNTTYYFQVRKSQLFEILYSISSFRFCVYGWYVACDTHGLF